MKKLFCLTVLVVAVGLFVLGCEKAPNPTQVPLSDQGRVESLAKASVFHDNFDIPVVNELAFNPCASENILFNGAFHVETHTVIDANGIFHLQFTANDHNLSGVGQTSETQYRRVGATVDNTKSVDFPPSFPPLVETFTNTFNFIGQGPGNNLIIQQVFHVTVNAKGVVTVLRDKLTIECR